MAQPRLFGLKRARNWLSPPGPARLTKDGPCPAIFPSGNANSSGR
jgi:hypothetical protein